MGLDTARSGLPTRAGWPVRRTGSACFQPITALDAPGPSTSLGWRLTLLLVLLGLVGAVLLGELLRGG